MSITYELATEPSKRETNFKAFNICIYGHPGSGKTTFASKLSEAAGEVYILDAEDGSKHIDGLMKSKIINWEAFRGFCLSLSKSDKYKHVVIDIADRVIEMLTDYICTKNKVSALIDIPYGGGYVAAYKLFFDQIYMLNNAGIGVTFITHTSVKEVKDERGVTYESTSTSLVGKWEEKIIGICDVSVFTFKGKTKDDYFLRCQGNRSYNCVKDRSGNLPEIMRADVNIFIESFKKNENK